MHKNWPFYAYLILSVSAVLLLVLKIIAQFSEILPFSNQQLTLAMFALVGLAYVLYSRELPYFFAKIILLVCGTYLILYNWIPYWEYGFAAALVSVFFPALFIKRNSKRRRSRFDQSDQG
jgi:predicted membrane protein